MLLSLLVGLSVQAAPAPESYVVVSRRSGVLRGQAFDLAVAARQALIDAGVPAPSLAEDATDCNGKKPCLLQRANAKKAAVLVTVDVGQVLDEVVVHAEALSVDEDGLKIAAVDAEGPMTAVGTTLTKKVTADLAPAIRKRLSLPAPAVAAAPTPPPAPEPSPPPPPEAKPEPAPAAVTAAPEVSTSTSTDSGFWTTRRTVGAVVGGVGAASLVTAAVLFGMAAGASGQVRSLCPDGQQCSDPAAYDAYARAGTLQNTALVVTGIGAAALAAGALLVLLPSGEASSSPSAVIVPIAGGAVMSFGGRF